MTRFCRSVARLRTTVYTFFLSAAEALRMNSEKGVEVNFLDFAKSFIETAYARPKRRAMSGRSNFSGMWLSIRSTPAL